jgi:hypothetical protein
MLRKTLLDLLVMGLRFLLGVVFVWASIDKIKLPGGFAQDIYNYRMLPHATINLMAIVMPWLELICGVVMIYGGLLLAVVLVVRLVRWIRSLPTTGPLVAVERMEAWSHFLSRGSSFLIGIMLAVFIIALSSALTRGLDITCGCFSVGGGHQVAADLLIRDIFLLAGAGIVMFSGAFPHLAGRPGLGHVEN